jgi:peptide deformylase
VIRPILKYGAGGLHDKAVEVGNITPDVLAIVGDMIDTMYAAPGVGLAAPQIGIPLRIFVVDVSVGRDPNGLIVVINPQFVVREGMQLARKAAPVLGLATVVRPTRAVVPAWIR